EQRHIAVRQGPSLPPCKRCEADLLEGSLDSLACDRITLRIAKWMQKAVRSLERYPEILRNGKLGKNAFDLQRALDAQPADFMRGKTSDVAAAEQDLARIGTEQAGDQVEQRCLAGAVGSDDRMQLAARQRQAQVVDRGKASEAPSQTAGFEHGCRHGSTCNVRDTGFDARSCSICSRAARHNPTRPFGARMTTRIAIRPTSREWCSQCVETTSRITMNNVVPIMGPNNVPAPPTIAQTTPSPDTW